MRAIVSEPMSAPQPTPVLMQPERLPHSSAMAPKPVFHHELEDRDPNKLNEHVQVVWDDVVGEPHGARSPECVWQLSRSCFQYSRDFCYTILTVLLAAPCALCLGVSFAFVAFEQVWCLSPYMRCVKIYLATVRSFIQMCLAALCVPFMDAWGHLLSHIRVNVRRNAPEERDFLVA